MNFMAFTRRPSAVAGALRAARRGGGTVLPAEPAPPTEGDADGGEPGLPRRCAT